MDQNWIDLDQHAVTHYRMRGTVAFGTLHLGNDDGNCQWHQVECYAGELRDKVLRMQEFGISSMPLQGASARVLFQNGHRRRGTIESVVDPRYRPTSLKPGEIVGYMVDGAGADGSGGTLRRLWDGLLGWIHDIYGRTINVGTHADTVLIFVDAQTIKVTADAISITGKNSVTITSDQVTINGQSGDVVVNGVSLVSHTHPDPQGGDTGPPNAS